MSHGPRRAARDRREAPPQRAERLAREFLGRVWAPPHDLGAIDRLMTADYEIASAGQVVRGRAAFKAWVAAFHRALPGATSEVIEVFASRGGDRVAARWVCRGRSAGIFGLPADGRPVVFSGIVVWAVRRGRLARGWVERSALEALRAAGGAP
jgi:predicted ester cyclase